MTRGIDHRYWEDEAAAYALRSLEDDERRRFERHLAGCPRCREEVESMRRTAAALPEPTPLAPPSALKDRVMAAVRAEASSEERVRPPIPERQSPAAEPWRLRRGRRAADRGRPRPTFSFLPPRLHPGAVVGVTAAVAALVVVAVLALGGGTSTRTYAAMVRPPGAGASLTVLGQTGRLHFSRLPAPPSGRIYEVWFQRAGQTVTPTRTLFASSSGSVALRGSLHGVRAVMVTAEPRPNGSRVPTTAPIIVVSLAPS